MRAWNAFLGELEIADSGTVLSSAEPSVDRPVLAIDSRVPDGRTGAALENKDGRNPLGETSSGVLRLVHDLSFPMPESMPKDLRGFPDLIERMGLWVGDESSARP